MTEKNKINIGQALRAARTEKGVTAREMAALIGIKQHSYILQVERGMFSDGDTPKRFFKALGFSYYDTYSWRIEPIKTIDKRRKANKTN